MTERSNNNGRAYEYACLMQLQQALSPLRTVKVIQSSNLEDDKRAWEKIGRELQHTLTESSHAAARTLMDLEELMSETDGDSLCLLVQSDKAGENGDVRDILIFRDKIGWEIGLSCKHNHFALKHSRISANLDFGEKWYGISCSETYWQAVRPIFQRLKEEESSGALWRDLVDKASTIYIPLLQAFIAEIKEAYARDETMAARLVEYLMGKYDYYKVISMDKDRTTQIRPYNAHGGLGRPGKGDGAKILIPKTSLPTRIVEVGMKPGSENTAELYMDEGWQFAFRIHNAETKVKPTLKFDIEAVGMPNTVIVINATWN